VKPFLLLARFAVVLCAVAPLLGMAKKKPEVTIRFHLERTTRDGDVFTSPIVVGNPPRTIYIGKMPEISERDVKAIWPVAAPDGSSGCALKLDPQGRLRLSSVSTEFRGALLVAFVNGRKVGELLVDKPVQDGVITIPGGITPAEMELFRKKWPLVGAKAKP
jgi:hypothetical protein